MAGPEARLGLETDMNGCVDIQAGLCEWLDGELPREQHAAVDAHLRQCAACSAAVAELRSAAQAVASLAPKKAPASILGGVRAQLRAEPAASSAATAEAGPTSSGVIRAGEAFERKPRLQPWTRGLISVAAFLAIGVLVFNAVAPYTPPSETMVAPESGDASKTAVPKETEYSVKDVPPANAKPLADAADDDAADGKRKDWKNDDRAHGLAQKEGVQEKAGSAESKLKGALQEKSSGVQQAQQNQAPFAKEQLERNASSAPGWEDLKKLPDGAMLDPKKELEQPDTGRGFAGPQPAAPGKKPAQVAAVPAAPSLPVAPVQAAQPAKQEPKPIGSRERNEAAAKEGGGMAGGGSGSDPQQYELRQDQRAATKDESVKAKQAPTAEHGAAKSEELSDEFRIRKDAEARKGEFKKAAQDSRDAQSLQGEGEDKTTAGKAMLRKSEGLGDKPAVEEERAETRRAQPNTPAEGKNALAAAAAPEAAPKADAEHRNRESDKLAKMRVKADEVSGFAAALQQLAARHGGRVEEISFAAPRAGRRIVQGGRGDAAEDEQIREADQAAGKGGGDGLGQAATGKSRLIKVALPEDKVAAFRTALSELQRTWQQRAKEAAKDLAQPNDAQTSITAAASEANPEAGAKAPAAAQPQATVTAGPAKPAEAQPGGTFETVEFLIELEP